MDPEAIDQLFKTLLHTSVTKTVHRDVYPAISASNFKLHQSGKAILITGGSSGVGFSTARAFVRASASIVIIVARSSDALATAVTSLEVEAKKAGTGTKIISKSLDVSDISAVKKFWEDLEKDEISVDVYIANAAKFTEPKPILELGADEVWSQMETNAKSPLYFVEKFYAQKGETEGKSYTYPSFTRSDNLKK